MRAKPSCWSKDLGERTLTHRLAVYVEKQFPGWQVDCDYDRLGERMLRMPHGTIISTDDHLGKSVYPDIVVHQPKFPTICSRSRCARRPIISRSSTISTSWPALTDPHSGSPTGSACC